MKKYALKDVVIAVCISILPFLFYVYKIIPEDLEVWETSFFTLGHGGFDNVSDFIWTICIKLLVIFLLVFWYTTCMHWWRLSILIPLVIELMKFISLINPNVDSIDEIDFIYSLPITIPIIVCLIFLSKKVGYYSISEDLNNELNGEIESIFLELNNSNIKELLILEDNLFELKRNKNKMCKKEYLKLLFLLRDKSLKLYLNEEI